MKYTSLFTNIEHKFVFDRVCDYLQRPWKVHNIHAVTKVICPGNMIEEMEDIYSSRPEFKNATEGSAQFIYYVSCNCQKQTCPVKLKVTHYHNQRCTIFKNDANHPSSSVPNPALNNLHPKVQQFIKQSYQSLKRSQIKDVINSMADEAKVARDD